MMTPRAERFRQRAGLHAASARRYRRNAETLHRQGEREAAGALLYEAAKRCINAVANQQGDNPVKTTTKFRALSRVVEQGLTDFDLHHGWHNASNLHSHADQSRLSDAEFDDAWEVTQTFITEMLNIYDQGQG